MIDDVHIYMDINDKNHVLRIEYCVFFLQQSTKVNSI